MKLDFENNFVVGLAYIILFIDFPYLPKFDDESLFGFIVYYSIYLIKLGALFIAGKVFVGDNMNNRVKTEIATSFLFFMILIGFFHLISDLFLSRFQWNFIVFLSLPWFFYFQRKDDERNH